MTAFLDARRHEVVARVLDEEERDRRHVVVALSGAHAYGYPSPDSGVELKAIHVEPSARLLGLAPPRPHHTRLEILDEIEIDYTTNELGPVLAGILQGNGGYIERVMGALTLRASNELASLRPLVKQTLSRRVYRHYQGFAAVQLREIDDARLPTPKLVLNVLRTTLTGGHLLRTGDLVLDVTRLLDQYGFGEALPLIEAKRSGERVQFTEELRDHWREEAHRAYEVLELSLAKSPLPDEPNNRDELEAWLLDVRREHF